MAVAERKRLITPEEYFELERAAEWKSEYYDGEIFAMAGASITHCTINGNVFAGLHARLRGKACAPYDSNLRINVSETGLYTYPDVSVVCGHPEFAGESTDTITNPTLIVEVLSDSTEAYNRGKKFQHYRTLPSFTEYVLISQKEPLVEVFHREPDQTWKLTPVRGLDGSAPLRSLDLHLPLSEIYYRVEFPESSPLKTPSAEPQRDGR